MLMTVIVLLYLRGFVSKTLADVNRFDAAIAGTGSRVHPVIQRDYDQIETKFKLNTEKNSTSLED